MDKWARSAGSTTRLPARFGRRCVQVGKDVREYGAGQSVFLPRGVWHDLWVFGDEPAETIGEAEPALGIEMTLATLAGLARKGKTEASPAVTGRSDWDVLSRRGRVPRQSPTGWVGRPCGLPSQPWADDALRVFGSCAHSGAAPVHRRLQIPALTRANGVAETVEPPDGTGRTVASSDGRACDYPPE